MENTEQLRVEERYQETTNNEGATFFVESSDNTKFHIYDKKTNELIGKTIVKSDAELTEKVSEIVTFKHVD